MKLIENYKIRYIKINYFSLILINTLFLLSTNLMNAQYRIDMEKAFNSVPIKGFDLSQTKEVEPKLNEYLSEYQLYQIDYNELYQFVYSNDKVCEFKLNLQGKDYIINIQRNDMRSKDYKFAINNAIVSNNSIHNRSNEDEVETFKGFANGKLGNIVRVTITKDNFWGYVYDQEKDKYISFQSVKSFLEMEDVSSYNKNFLVFDLNKLKTKSNQGCGIVNDQIINYKKNIQARSQYDKSCEPINIEIATDADVEYFNRWSNNSNTVIRTQINLMEGFYSRYFRIKFEITFQNINTNYNQTLSSLAPEILLDSFRQFRYRTRSIDNIKSDIFILFSNKNTNTSILGIAYLNGVGDDRYKFGSVYTTNTYEVLAHEVGHLLGATHDSIDVHCKSSGINSGLMCPYHINNFKYLSKNSIAQISDIFSIKSNLFEDVGFYNGTWINTWTSNSNWIGGWNLNSNDQKLVGDYDGDGDEELLFVSNWNWSSIQDFSCSMYNIDWYTKWHNGGSGWIGGWKMASGDKHLVGDFNGDGKSDILSINDNKYWSSVATFNKNTGSWVGLWHNNGNHWISGWYISNGDDYKIADFDNDGKDEILCISSTGWAALLDFENNNFSVKWHNSGSGWIGSVFINQYSKLVTGKFSTSNQSELIVNTGNYRTLLYWNKFTNSWSSLWSEYNSKYDHILSFPSSICSVIVGIAASNKFHYFSGNLDSDPRDELITIDRCWARTSEFINGVFQNVWDNKGSEVAFPNWESSSFDDYIAIKTVQGLPKQLLAFKYQPTSLVSGNYNAPLVKASMYRANGFQNKLEQARISNQENEEILLFPNPNEGKFNVLIKGSIDYESEKVIHVTDMNGREVYTQSFKEPNVSIDLSGKSKGMYFVEVKTTKKTLNTKFIIK